LDVLLRRATFDARTTKIDDLHPRRLVVHALRHQDILGLEVAVHDARRR